MLDTWLISYEITMDKTFIPVISLVICGYCNTLPLWTAWLHCSSCVCACMYVCSRVCAFAYVYERILMKCRKNRTYVAFMMFLYYYTSLEYIIRIIHYCPLSLISSSWKVNLPTSCIFKSFLHVSIFGKFHTMTYLGILTQQTNFTKITEYYVFDNET